MEEAFKISKEIIQETLTQKPVQGKRGLDPLKSFSSENKIPLQILEDCDVSTNEAEIHVQDGDLFGCLEGKIDFVTGGELVEPKFSKNKDGSENKNEMKGSSIEGGKITTLEAGDWFFIPPGVPHQHNLPKGTARLFIIKVPKK